MKRVIACLLAAVLLSLTGCATMDRVDLPQLRELQWELADPPQVASVHIFHYSTAPFLSIDLTCWDISREDVFSLVRAVRRVVMEEDFQRDYYDLMKHEDGWERIMSGQYYPDGIRMEVSTLAGRYTFESQLFSDGSPSTGGKGSDYDGYATWWGSFSKDGDEVYFTHEDIMDGK